MAPNVAMGPTGVSGAGTGRCACRGLPPSADAVTVFRPGDTAMLRAIIVLLALCAFLAVQADDGSPGATRIARWRDDKTAAFMLMFDDSASSQVKFAIPELVKRQMVGTFYVNAGSGQYKAFKDDWEKRIPAMGMELANHTYTHKGATDLAKLDEEVLLCNEAILNVISGGRPHLVSFGIPGVPKGAWTVTNEQIAQVLGKYHLIERPPVGGHFASIDLHGSDEMFKLVQKAIDSGGAQFVIFHGVGGDWLTEPLPDFIDLLDKLVAVRDKLWIAGHIAVHQYQTEREVASVQVTQGGGKQFKVMLSCKADPALFVAPLTLVTRVPASWKKCHIVQGTAASDAVVEQGTVRYDAVPGTLPVVITGQP